MNTPPAALQPKQLINAARNCIQIGRSARVRAEQTSRLVGAATQAGRPSSPSLPESATGSELDDIIVYSHPKETSLVAVPGPGLSLNVTRAGDAVLRCRPQALRAASRGPRLLRPDPFQPTSIAETEPLSPAINSATASPGAAAVASLRAQPSNLSPQSDSQKESVGACVPSSRPSPAWQPSATTTLAPAGHPCTATTAGTRGATDLGTVLSEFAHDGDVLLKDQAACLVALDRLTRVATTAAVTAAPPRGPRLSAHAGCRALLLALRGHCTPPPPILPPPPSASFRHAPSQPLSLHQLLHISNQLLRLRLRNQGCGSGGAPQPPGQARRAVKALGAAAQAASGGYAAEAAVSAALHDLAEGLADAAAEQLEGPPAYRIQSAGGLPPPPPPLPAAAGLSTAASGSCAAAILPNLVKLGCYGGGGVQRLTAALASIAIRHAMVPSLDVRTLQDLIWALGKLDEHVRQLPPVRQLLAVLAARLAEPGLLGGMTAIGLSMVVYGMGKAGVSYTDARVRQAVAAAVAAAAAAPACGPQALANMAWGLSRTAPSSSAAAAAAPAAAGASALTVTMTHGTRRLAAARPPRAAAVTPAPSEPAQQHEQHQQHHPQHRHVADGALDTSTCIGHGTAEAPPELAVCVQLATAAARQLDRFKPREAANLLGGLASLGALTDPRVAPLLDAGRAYLRRRLGELGPHDLAEVLYSYAVAAGAHRLQPETDWPAVAAAGTAAPAASSSAEAAAATALPRDLGLWALLDARCLAVLPSSPAYQVVTMLWAFAHLPHRPTGLMAAVVGSLVRAGAANPPAVPVCEPTATLRHSRAQQQRGQQQEHKQRRQHRNREDEREGPAAAPPLLPSPPTEGSLVDSGAHWGPVLELELDSLPSAQTARLVWALARLGARVPPAALQRLYGALRSRVAEFDTQSLLMTLWGLATLACPSGDSALEEALVGRLAALLPALEPHQLPLALWAVAKLAVGGPAAGSTSGGGAAAGGEGRRSLSGMSVLRFFQASRSPLAAAAPRLAPRGVAMAAWACASAGVNPGEAALAALWERALGVVATVATAGPQEVVGKSEHPGQALAMVAGAMAEFRCRHDRLTRAVAAAAAARMAVPLPPLPPPTQMPPSQARGSGGLLGCDAAVADGVWLSSVVCSLGRLGVSDVRVLQLAGRRARLLAAVLTPREAIPLLWGLGAIRKHGGGAGTDAGAGNAGGRTAAGSQNQASDSLPGAVAALTEGIERAVLAAAAPPAAASAASTSTRESPRRGAGRAAAAGAVELDGGLLSMYLIACVAHRHRPPAAVLEAASALLTPQLGSLASHTLCEVAWALATLRPPLEGHVGFHAVLPYPGQPPEEADADAATAVATAAAAAAVQHTPAARTLDARNRKAGAGGGGGKGRKSSSKEGQATSAAAAGADSAVGPGAASQAGTFAVSDRATGGSAAERTAQAEVQEAHASGESEADMQSASGHSGDCPADAPLGVAALAPRPWQLLQRQRSRWPLRWDRPEVPLVLAARRQGLRLRGTGDPERRPPMARACEQQAAAEPQQQRHNATCGAISRVQTDSRVSASGIPGLSGGTTPVAGTAAGAVTAAPQQPRLASRVAPSYPPRHVVPAGMASSQRLLAGCLELLARRLCVERSEFLTLESLVKVVWAMCVTRMYTPRLFGYCAARALCCSTARLQRRSDLMRALVQVRALVARQRPSVWRRLSLRRRWRRRLAGGAAWSVAPADLAAAAPPGAVRALQRCRASLDAAAEATGLGLEWRSTFEGDRHGVLRLGSRSACALLVVPPWEEPEPPASQVAAMAPPTPAPLAGAAVAARLLLLRGWLVAAVRVEAWLALDPAEQQQQMRALHTQMRAAARMRAQILVAASEAAAAAAAAAGLGGVSEASFVAAGAGSTSVGRDRRSSAGAGVSS